MRIRFSTARIVGLALAAAFVTAPLTGLHAQDTLSLPTNFPWRLHPWRQSNEWLPSS